MKIKLDYFFNFVKSNPYHFTGLDPEITKMYEFGASNSCNCAGGNSQLAASYSHFKKLLCIEETRTKILDKSKELLDDSVQIEDFSVNSCSENLQNK